MAHKMSKDPVVPSAQAQTDPALAAQAVQPEQTGVAGTVANTISSITDKINPNAAGAQTQLDMQSYIAQQTAPAPGSDYATSVRRVLDQSVFDEKSIVIGKTHDIIVAKDTGMAALLVVSADNTLENDFPTIGFDKVTKQSPDGTVTLSIDKSKMIAQPDLNYAALKKNPAYISLRHLQDGQIIDDRGKVAGQIKAVLYENAKAQMIYFTLAPGLGNGGIAQIPFTGAHIVNNPDGYDVQLSHNQTAALAQQIFPETTAK